MVQDDAVLCACLEVAWRIVNCSEPWQRRLVTALRPFFDDDVSVQVVELGWNRADAPSARGWIEVTTPEGGFGRREARLDTMGSHPGLLRVLAGELRPQRLSDVVDLPRFRETELFVSVHGRRPPGTRFAAAVPLGVRRDGMALLGGHRRRRDFDAEDMRVLELVGAVIPPAVAFRTAVDLVAAHVTPAPGRVPHTARGVDQGSRASIQPAGAAGAYRPTPREQDVLVLLAQGLTNRQIARRLDITERTVRKHLDSVYTRGDLKGRAAAAAWWERSSPSPG